ncbi:hypothetical protein GWD52_10570 [Enterobacteriaceae bacterium 4M9]|nr:hypothetical protein [Enterobacteriaceae bacterium 4M9]
MAGHTVSRNAVERKMAELNLTWLSVSENESKRVFIWRAPADAIRLVQAFFALQEAGESEFSLPDMFVSTREPYDTSYNFSRTVAEQFVERAARTELPTPHWDPTTQLPCWLPGDVASLLDDFARYVGDGFRYLVMLLQPSSIISKRSFNDFVGALCALHDDTRARFALIDTQEDPAWQWLADRYPEQVQIISIDASQGELARQIINETPTTDGSTMLRFRQLMTDTFLALKSGDAPQVIQTGQKALDIATQLKIPEQQVVVLSLMAGAWLKAGEPHKAIERYINVQSAGEQSAPESRHHLVTQGLMAEGNAWYMAKDPFQASERYARAALRARQIPSLTLEMEGHRMAGFTLLEHSRWRSAAADHYFSALTAALAMNEEERSSCNLMQVFRDLLNWREPGLTTRCNQLAETWLSEQQQLIAHTERQIAAARPDEIRETVARCDAELVIALEVLFEKCISQREALLAQGAKVWRELLSLARCYSYPFWCPGTDFSHPTEQPVERWGCRVLTAPASPEPAPQTVRTLFRQILTDKEDESDAQY